MNADDKPAGTFSLRRWSSRKHAAARERSEPVAEEASTPIPAAAVVPPESVDAQAPAPQSAVAADPRPPLPPVESLTSESDFVPFMQADVDETVKRAALRKLFSDPHYNVMDGLDVYIDDYSKPDPIAPEIVQQLVQLRYLIDPPRTRVNAQGNVEDVPPEPPAPAQDSPTEAAAEASPVDGEVAAIENDPPMEATLPPRSDQPAMHAATPASPADPLPDRAALPGRRGDSPEPSDQK